MRIQIPTFLRRHSSLAIVAVSAVVALVAAVASVYEIGVLPPKMEKRQLQVGAGVTRALVDLPRSETDRTDRTAVDTLTEIYEVDALTERAEPLAKVMASPKVLERIGQRIGVDSERISAATPITGSVPRSLAEPDSERRANQILASTDPYRLEIQARPNLPVLDIYTQAPSADQARRLADASVDALNAYLRDLAGERDVPPVDRVSLTQLGPARGGPLDPTAPAKIAGLAFLVVFGITWGVLVLFAGIRRGWRKGGRSAAMRGARAAASAAPSGRLERRGDDWPHTTRVLPWMIAAFIAMLWLVPFNAIALDISLPVDLNLDRLVLPVIVVTWVLALALGGHSAPSLQLTPIHAGIAAFAAVACLSVVLNAGDLNQTLGLDLAIKKLTLLVAYVSVFVMVASVVRRSEVRAFLTFMLVLAVICAVGMIWEYRYGFNVFYDLSAKLLPGFFQVEIAPAGFDELGRRSVSGPADHGLEAVAILSMAIPIALIGMMDARRLRGRFFYGLAALLLGAAAISTYRKSALLAPFSACLTLAYFRRRDLLRLAPLAAVGLAALLISSFSALGSVAGQFDSDRLDVPTVGDRVSDYDAIRPDILSHPAFGLGFGSYEHAYSPTNYRILDSDVLMRVVETGLVGLAAFVLMIVTVMAVAAPSIRGGDPGRASPALAVTAAAAAFLVLSALFDEWSFPHAPYVFLILAGFLAVIVSPDAGESPPRPSSAPGRRSPDPTDAPPIPDRDPRRVPTPV